MGECEESFEFHVDDHDQDSTSVLDTDNHLSPRILTLWLYVFFCTFQAQFGLRIYPI